MYAYTHTNKNNMKLYACIYLCPYSIFFYKYIGDIVKSRRSHLELELAFGIQSTVEKHSLSMNQTLNTLSKLEIRDSQKLGVEAPRYLFSV